MASFAEMIYGTAQDVAQGSFGGVAEKFAQGAQLALKQEELQQNRAQLEQRKQQLESAKWDKLGQLYEQYDKMPDGPAKKNFGTKVIPANLSVMGLSQDMNPAVAEMLTVDPEMGAFLRSRALEGKVTQAQIAQAIKDPQKFTSLANELGFASWADEKMISGTAQKYGPEIAKAEETALKRQSEERASVARAQAAGSRGNEIQGRFEQSQKTKLVDKLNAIGIPGLKSAVSELDSAMPSGIDGWKPGQKIPGISGADGALPVNRLTGKANKVRGSAASIGNQILKLRSGAAVSDGEAVRTLAELGMTPVVGEGGTWTGLAWKGVTSEEAFVNGMKRARGIIQSVENSYRNAYGSDVYDAVSPPIKNKGASTVSFAGRNLTKDDFNKIISDPKAPKTLKEKAKAALKQFEGQ